MASRRRYPKPGPPPEGPGEQTPAGGGSPDAMPDRPLQVVDAENWWSPDDASLPVGQTHEEEDEGRPIPARRLLIAGVLIFILTTVTVVFLPDIVAVLSPMGAMIAFAAIIASAVVTAAPKQPTGRAAMDDNAKPVSCGGPRPIGEMSRRMANKKDDGCGPSCGC
ncbi:MAG: hypothetical protein NCW75_09700 [Phycisphaera sp.]|nr:MAG: hypothetical protein NCW75_09700 [Phycisphaera sp.]